MEQIIKLHPKNYDELTKSNILNQKKQYKIPGKSTTIYVGDRIINTKNKDCVS